MVAVVHFLKVLAGVAKCLMYSLMLFLLLSKVGPKHQTKVDKESSNIHSIYIHTQLDFDVGMETFAAA